MSQTDTRTEILNLARGYLQSMGFNAFSFQTIADALGIRKASIHYHFKSKEEMGVALLEEYIEGFRQWSDRRTGDRSARRKIDGFLRIYESFISNQSRICPIGVLSSDWNTLPESMKERLREFHEEQRRWLVNVIKEGRQTEEFSFDGSAEDAADLILSAVQGAVQIARVRGDMTPLKNTFRFIIKRLKSSD